jgi:hypothetical protein
MSGKETGAVEEDGAGTPVMTSGMLIARAGLKNERVYDD